MVSAVQKRLTLLERFDRAESDGKIDISEEGGVLPIVADPTLADELVARLPANILASGSGAIRNALRK
jgi:hypothetical protein